MGKITEIVPGDLPEFARDAFAKGQYFTESVTAKWAMEVLSQRLKDDPDYAYSWHCNIAMACYDSMNDIDHEDRHTVSNEAASRFMKMAFDVDTKYIGPPPKE